MGKYLLGSLIVSLLSLALYLYFYLGVSKPVDIAVENRSEPLYLLFQTHVGPYHEIMPTIQSVESWAAGHNVPCPKTFGEFLDNPEAVDQDRLRAKAGCVLTGALAEVPKDYEYEVRAGRSYAVGRFGGSPAIGPMTVYPAMAKFLEEQRLESDGVPLEVYTVDGQTVSTEYLFPIVAPAAPKSDTPPAN